MNDEKKPDWWDPDPEYVRVRIMDLIYLGNRLVPWDALARFYRETTDKPVPGDKPEHENDRAAT